MKKLDNDSVHFKSKSECVDVVEDSGERTISIIHMSNSDKKDKKEI